MPVLVVQGPHSPSHWFTLQGVSRAEAWLAAAAFCKWQWRTCTHKGWASHGTLENDSTTWLGREGQLFASLSVFWLQPSLIFWKMLPFSVLSKVNIWSVVKDELQSGTRGWIQIQQGGWELLCSFLQTVICNGLQQPAEIPTTWSIKKRLNEPFHSRIFFPHRLITLGSERREGRPNAFLSGGFYMGIVLRGLSQKWQVSNWKKFLTTHVIWQSTELRSREGWCHLPGKQMVTELKL